MRRRCSVSCCDAHYLLARRKEARAIIKTGSAFILICGGRIWTESVVIVFDVKLMEPFLSLSEVMYSYFKMAAQTGSSYISVLVVARDKIPTEIQSPQGLQINKVDADFLQVRFLSDIKTAAMKPEVLLFVTP